MLWAKGTYTHSFYHCNPFLILEYILSAALYNTYVITVLIHSVAVKRAGTKRLSLGRKKAGRSLGKRSHKKRSLFRTTTSAVNQKQIRAIDKAWTPAALSYNVINKMVGGTMSAPCSLFMLNKATETRLAVSIDSECECQLCHIWPVLHIQYLFVTPGPATLSLLRTKVG